MIALRRWEKYGFAKYLGFSQSELSRRANIDVNTLKCIYRAPTAVLTTETLDKRAKALGVDASELIESLQDEFGQEALYTSEYYRSELFYFPYFPST
jgi:transcriptional regulator with XRE-family HTH domain